jgi:hypothetical protein
MTLTLTVARTPTITRSLTLTLSLTQSQTPVLTPSLTLSGPPPQLCWPALPEQWVTADDGGYLRLCFAKVRG